MAIDDRPNSAERSQTLTIYYGGFISRAGGAFGHAKTIENELCKMGWNVVVITLDSLPFWCRYIPHAVEKVSNIISMPLGFVYKGIATRILYKLFFDDKVDVRIFEDIYLTWDSATPSITILHAVWSDNLQSYSVTEKQLNSLKQYEAKIIEGIKQPIATVSRPYLNFLKEVHFDGRISKQLLVVELGIDQSGFRKTNNRNPKRIVYTGALEPRKNVLFLLKVFKKLGEIDPDFRLTIIGDGPDRKELVDFVKTNGLPVEFLGRLSHDDVVTELHRNGIYLHTSTKESFSYSLLEAKLAGLKTCAYAGLQVPAEFIDVAIGAFDVDEWCKGILNIDWAPGEFDGSRFTDGNMTLSTLKLVDRRQ